MRQQEVFNKIGAILNELNELYDYLKSQPVPLDDLEIELFAANANFLTDHLEILRKLNAAVLKGSLAHNLSSDVDSGVSAAHTENQITVSPALSETMPIIGHFQVQQPDNDIQDNAGFEFDLTTTNKTAFVTDEKEDVPTVNEDIAYFEDASLETQGVIAPETDIEKTPEPHIDLKPDTGHDHFSFIRSTELDIIRHELELNEADTFSEDETVAHEETIAEALAEKKHDDENYDQIVQEKPVTLNERIAAQSGTIPEQSAVKPITDLKSAINLNDKMLFVRDLFNGYSLAYSEAIEILNRFTKLEDAEKFLSNNYEVKNNWPDKPATREKFYDLLKRRFA